MAIMVYDYEGVLPTYHIPIINKKFKVIGKIYANFLQKILRPKVWKLRPSHLECRVLILHDNASPHETKEVTSILDSYNWGVLLPHSVFNRYEYM